jgi:hypothetical protein
VDLPLMRIAADKSRLGVGPPASAAGPRHTSRRRHHGFVIIRDSGPAARG